MVLSNVRYFPLLVFCFFCYGRMKLRVFSIKRKSSWNTPKYWHLYSISFDLNLICYHGFFCSVQQFLVKRNWTDRSWTAWAWITKSKTMKVLKVIIQIVRGEIKRAKWKISIMFDRSLLVLLTVKSRTTSGFYYGQFHLAIYCNDAVNWSTLFVTW